MKMISFMNNISDNIDKITSKMIEAAKRAGRKEDDVTLVAVSKTKPIEDLKEAYNHGVRDFGENYVNELTDKIPQMPDDVRWHMIGHLQTNKVKYIVGKVYMIHSVDSVKLAKEISKESVKKDTVTKILCEINVAGEDSKFGTSDLNANLEMIKEISALPNIELCGLMTIAPYTTDAESNRQYFRTLHDFAYGEAKEYLKGEPVLSMGMSGDFEVAVEEGASYIRVGSSIFGERVYNK